MNTKKLLAILLAAIMMLALAAPMRAARMLRAS